MKMELRNFVSGRSGHRKTYEKAEIDELLRGRKHQEISEVHRLTRVVTGQRWRGSRPETGRASGGLYRGAAYESELIVVRLGIPDPAGFPRTAELMSGMDLAVRKALELGRPMAVNLSFGNTYGSHDGGGLLEVSRFPGADGTLRICDRSGNEGIQEDTQDR